MQTKHTITAPKGHARPTLIEEINLAIEELNVLINQKGQDLNVTRIQALFSQLTDQPVPQSLLNIL